MLIYRVHLVFLILEQHLLFVYCFTLKQSSLIVIKSKTFSHYALFCTLAALIFHLFVYFVYVYIFALIATNSVMIFPPSSSFIMPVTFLFFPVGSGLLSSFEYPLVSNFVSASFAMSL